MACPDADALDRFVGGSLPAAERARLTAHLDACDACRRVVSEAARVDTMLAAGGGALALAATGAAEPETIGGKYRIERLLGKGGMGAVYLAENVDIGRKVALKILHARLAGNAEIAQRFRMEARAAAAIGHPGIVDVLDFGVSSDGEPFIVMERLEGETLGARLKRGGTLAAREAVAIVGEVLDALAAAHAKHIVHRDLKPENVFLCERPLARAKILDFGISKFAGADDVSLTRTGTVMGSPLYMSPEQARDAKDIGPATDLYAVGVILYEALAGAPPFAGASYNEVIANILTEPHAPLATRRPDVPAALAAIVDRLLAKDASARPASAIEVKAALEAALDGRALTPAADAGPSARRPWLPWAAATLVVAAVAVGVVVTRWPRAPTPQPVAPTPAAPTPAAPTPAAPTLAAPTPAAPTPAAPTPAAPTPTQAQVTLTLRAQPAEATWSLDGVALACNPCTVTRDAASHHVALAQRSGYADERVELLFDRAREEQRALRPLPPVAATAPRLKPKSAPSPTPTPSPPKPTTAPAKGMTIDKTDPF